LKECACVKIVALKLGQTGRFHIFTPSGIWKLWCWHFNLTL